MNKAIGPNRTLDMVEQRRSGIGFAFLDRDGTINLKAPANHYITSPDDLILLPGAASAIRALNDAEIPTVVVTNQRGIARGMMTESDLGEIHNRMALLLADQAGARIDLFVYCPHETGQCTCRKPQPGMFYMAQRVLGKVDLASSVMIGDAASDMKAADAFGITGLPIEANSGGLLDAVHRYLRTSRVAK